MEDEILIFPISEEQQKIVNRALEFEASIINKDYEEDPDSYILDYFKNERIDLTDFKEFRFPLLASIPEENIYLYSIAHDYRDKCMLFVEDEGYRYEIPWLTPHFYLPQMKLYDYDKDGKEELAIINYYGSGSAFSLEGLYIVKINEEIEQGESYPIYSLTPDEYMKQLNEAMSYIEIDKSNQIFELEVDNKTHTLNFSDFFKEEGDEVIDIFCTGDIVRFNFKDNSIRAEFEIAAKHKEWIVPHYFGSIYADCVFEDNTFTLTNFSFVSNM